MAWKGNFSLPFGILSGNSIWKDQLIILLKGILLKIFQQMKLIVWAGVYATVILTGYLVFLSAKAISYNIVTGKEASLRLIRELFMNLLEPQDQNILHKVWSEVTYTSVLILEMAELFSNHSITQLPTRSTVEVLLNYLEQHTICMKPFYYIHT